MSNEISSSSTTAAERHWVWRVHRWVAVIAAPFFLVSIVLAVGLSHQDLLSRWSEDLWDSQPLPAVALDEPVRPGSWEQALQLAKLAVGKDGHVITTRSDGKAVVQAFESHSHDPAVAQANRHIRVIIDTASMRIARMDDRDRSLASLAHGVHAWQFMDLPHANVTTVSSVGLILLVVTGMWGAWVDRHASRPPRAAARSHFVLGALLIPLLLVIAFTSMQLEFGWLLQGDRKASLPIPVASMADPVQAGSLDQAKALAERVAGAPMRAVFIRETSDWKFSEAGDGIGGQSVWLDAQTMKVSRITDWRNDPQSLTFIIHDGRWLGGLNAVNIHDLAALGLLLLIVSGGLLARSAAGDRKLASK
jgi:hypothetical protein